jgi:anti-sigma factor (TIGR02949 family)
MSDTNRMTCEEALRLLAEFIDGELADAARHEVHEHLETCRACYSRAEFERRLKAQLVTLGAAPVRPELEQRVRTLIGQFNIAPAPVDANEK